MFKGPLLTENTVDLIINQIKSTFNATISDVDNFYSDGISLEKIDNEAFYITDKMHALTLPAVFVLFGAHAFQYTRDPNYLESEDECVVVCSFEDVGADVLQRKAWRYGRVLMNCLNLVDLKTPDDRLNLHVVPLRLGYTEQITNKLGKEQSKFRMECVLELRIKHFEKNLA